MGNGISNKRLESASQSGIFVASKCNLCSWRKISKAIAKLNGLRGMALDNNNLSKPIPHVFLRTNTWETLQTLDISGNNLKCACVLGYWGACKPSANRTGPQGLMSSTVCPLEVLNLSNNFLLQLPPLLLQAFPKLRRLLCRGNKRSLDVDGGLLQRVGPSASLQTVDLGQCALREFFLAHGADEVMAVGHCPFPSLRELFLDGNHIGGTFALVSVSQPMAAGTRFLQLKTVSLAAQRGAFVCLDPSVYSFAPFINVINIKENEHEENIMDEIRKSEEYKDWSARHKDEVTKQLVFTGSASLL